ncbi:ABC transporter substrate-binding protein [Noviherbaspirillum sedimenti]|uniref:ABC transporter substrate-binding protein n=1 Tax=Noviherbaspirillum sedimenti TaxID=2320865 RepID=A0A3A3G3Q1_9BURK|nr:ABC transporter substrate-binding protein [Noviherbaspirillum sedimenti]RJG01429.1 ABC transporter substrate-binding protein [Noviherbaspirillum sedimenti]
MKAHRSSVRKAGLAVAALSVAVSAAFAPAAHAADNGKFRIGIVTFLSGGAAGPFGVPAANAAKLVVEALNKGGLPAPYNKKGINGIEIETVIIDENGGATKQVEEYRNLVQRQKVDAVIGYISSGDCLAIAPVAEELKMPTVFFDCGTSRLFEAVKSPKYTFRTGLDAVVDNVALARYIVETRPNIKTVASIQQNYSFGQDSWNDFILTLKHLKPTIKVASEQWPKLMQGQYGAEISALSVANADLVHSSFWGGDMEALMLQGSARGLFDKNSVALTCGDTGIEDFKDKIPNGVIIGARGPYGAFAPKNALNDWFRPNFTTQFKESPTYPAYKMAQAILGIKAAVEKTAKPNAMPTADNITQGLKGLSFEAPSGTVKMASAGGHQAVQGVTYGEYHYDAKTKKASLTKVKSYAAECLMPPDGTPAVDWIKAGMPGAKCQ